MKKKKTKVISTNYMDKIPVRALDHPWKEDKDGKVVIEMKHEGFYARIATRYFKKPSKSQISLDKYGSVVWKGCDGKNTIYDIVLLMENTFPDEKDKMLNRVVTFMATLENSKFIFMK